MRSMGNIQGIVNSLRHHWVWQPIAQLLVILAMGAMLRLSPSFEGTIQALWQYLPPSVIEQHGWRSLYYLHQQPPLLNAIIVFIIQLGGRGALEGSIQVIMLIILLANLILINRITSALKLNLATSWIFVLFPAFWLYHTWFYEPAFTMFFTNCVILGLVITPSALTFLLATVGLVGLTLTHGSFHPAMIYCVFALAWFLIFRKCNLRRTIVIAGILLAIPTAFLFKNLYLAGSPSLSTWAGCNLHQKFMHAGTGFEYTPREIPGAPNILGAAKFTEGDRVNTNNLDFATHCNENLRLILTKVQEPGEFLAYLSRVAETIRSNESSLSLEYRGAGFSPSHWGLLSKAIEQLITFKKYYELPLLLISLFAPILTLALLIKHKLFKPFFVLTLIYYFGLSIAHLANGWEQMRMAYRSSFFLYICVLLSLHSLLKRFTRIA
jgi:hypothetical protein